MLRIGFMVVALGWGLVGCASVTQADVDRAAGLYRQVEGGMTKEQVTRLLGPPKHREDDGGYCWETWAPRTDSFARLVVYFDARGRIWRFSRNGPTQVRESQPLIPSQITARGNPIDP